MKRFVQRQNDMLEVSGFVIVSPKLAPGSVFRIVHLSDLHGKRFGAGQRELVDKVETERPNLIVFTGDLVDAVRWGAEAGLELMERLVKLAPVYFVSGNHEWRSGKFVGLERKLLEAGVNVLRNAITAVAPRSTNLVLLGIDDPMRMKRPAQEKRIIDEDVRALVAHIDVSRHFIILLSHRPEVPDVYARHRIDLTFSGHAHGGQFRLPLIGGLYAPHQGVFPRYTAGKHRRGQSELLISRGLGNSTFPLRLFNRPEIVVAELRGEP